MGTSTVSGCGSTGISAVSSRGMPLRSASSHSVGSGPLIPAGAALQRTASRVYPASASTDTGASG